MFVSFGLWNVLLLPFSIRELEATEFEYGLQEGLTSVGFVWARSSWRASRAACRSRSGSSSAWSAWASAGIFYGLSTSIPLAIVLVMITGFFNSPSSVARSVLLQRHTPREMRGPRVLRLLCHARHHLPDRDGRRRSRRYRRHPACSSSSPPPSCSCPPRSRWWRPGSGWHRCAQRATRLRDAEAPAMEGTPMRPATVPDFGRIAHRLPPFARLSADQRDAFLHDATDPPGAGGYPGRRAGRRRERRRTSSSRARRRPGSRMRTDIAAFRPWAPATSSGRSRR